MQLLFREKIMSSLRLEKINSLIREELGKLFLTETSLKEGVFVTIAKVRVTPDIRNAFVSVSVFPEHETEYALKSLQKELSKIQQHLNLRLSMRPLPRLILESDETEQQAQAVEEAISVLKKERESRL